MYRFILFKVMFQCVLYLSVHVSTLVLMVLECLNMTFQIILIIFYKPYLNKIVNKSYKVFLS